MTPNCESCPVTHRVLEELAESHTATMTGFSLLKGRSSIPRHADEKLQLEDGKQSSQAACDPVSHCEPLSFTVNHLGLEIPGDAPCLLILHRSSPDGTTTINQENGKMFNFRDCVEHSAVNASHKDRLILYIKVAEN
jgi:hypothetical protein